MTKFQEELESLKYTIGSKFVFAVLFICVIAFPVSLLNWQSHGFDKIYAVHALFFLAALVLAVRRQENKYKLNVGFAIVFLTLLTAHSILTTGWSGAALSILISTFFILTVLFSTKLRLIYLLFCVFSFAIINVVGEQIMPILDDSNLIANGTVLAKFGLSSAVYSLLIVTIGFGFVSILLFELFRKLILSLTANEEKDKEINYLANHDLLTGLSSPRLAQEQLELTLNMAKRHEFKAAILYIDIDQFRLINEALGHDAGDFALKEVANMLKELIRDTDIACRQGGDEFLLILHYPVSREACDLICKRLIAAFDARFPYKEHEIKINLNIGVAIYPDNGDTQLELRTKADKAKQKSKRDKKHHFTFAD